MSDRNENAELLELLEVYVVASICGLDTDRERQQSERVQALIGEASDWRRALRQRLALPDDFESALVEAYEEHRVSAEDGGLSLEPEDFARSFVMRNLVVDESD